MPLYVRPDDDGTFLEQPAPRHRGGCDTLVMVHSRPGQAFLLVQEYKSRRGIDPDVRRVISGAFDARQTIRETWGRGPRGDACVVFCLGRTAEQAGQADARAEAERQSHGDVLLVDATDHYNNLTLKTMLALKYFVNRSHFVGPELPRYLFKVDEDAFVHLARLPDTLREALKASARLAPEGDADDFVVGSLFEEETLRER